MKPELPPIVSASERLQLEIEQAVKRWTRENRYAHGLVLRNQAMLLVQAAYRMWREPGARRQNLFGLDEALQNLIQSMQLGHRLKAFASFKQFEAMIRQAEDIGRQIGALKRHHSKGQNSVRPSAQQERAKTLSARPASIEANA